jgi:dipeptidyl aminopeptidase/acylaminoacyl peptidase
MKSNFLIRVFALSILLPHGAVIAADAESSSEPRRSVAIDDISAVIDIGALRLSPDGKWIAYESDDLIFLVPTRAGPARPVTESASAASDPHWSVDGKTLYFLSDRSGSSQVWKLGLEEFGEASQLTELEFPVNNINLSPDESRLLLPVHLPSTDAPESKVKKPWVMDRLQFKEDSDDGYITDDPPGHFQVYEIASHKLTPVTSGAYSASDSAWSPDGREIAFVSNREANPDATYRTDIWRVSASGAGDTGSPIRVTGDEHTKQSPAWSPDGKSIAWIDAEDGVYGIQQIAIVPAAGGTPRILTGSLDRWVSEFRFSADGRYIYFSYDDGGGVNLARVSLRNGEIEPLMQGEYVVSSFDVDGSGKVAATMNTSNDAPDLYLVQNKKPQRLTNTNAAFFNRVSLGNKVKAEFSSNDGTRVEAFITTPPDFVQGRRYPTVLGIHGGPVGQFTWGYDFGTQFLAANGYVVVEPNPRGSTGRGQAFIRGIYQSWGITDYDDVIAAVDHAVSLGISDPDRLAVFGYSYGGYMTNVVITRTERFRAAASGAGHSLIIANYGHDIYQKWYNWELGVPWENRDLYDRMSPLLQVGRVQTPTIFLGGREDWNVPVLNAELFYQSLKQRGIPTQLIVYPDTHHSNWDEEYEKDFNARIVGWFDKYVKMAAQ